MYVLIDNHRELVKRKGGRRRFVDIVLSRKISRMEGRRIPPKLLVEPTSSSTSISSSLGVGGHESEVVDDAAEGLWLGLSDQSRV